MTLQAVEIGEMLQVVGKWAIPQVEGTEEIPQMVEIGVRLQEVGTGASLMQERGLTPPVEKKVMTQVGETKETPQSVGTGVMSQVAWIQVIPQVVGTGVRPQVVEM